METELATKISKATKLIESALSQKHNVLQYFGLGKPPEEKLREGINILKNVAHEYNKNNKKREYSDIMEYIISLYDRLFSLTIDPEVRRSQGVVIKELIEYYKINDTSKVNELSKKYVKICRQSDNSFIAMKAYCGLVINKLRY